MIHSDLDAAWASHSDALDLDAVPGGDVAGHPVSREVVGPLACMQQFWMDRHLGPNGRNGGRNGHGLH